ncbi:MAG: hypothetical protein U9P49_02830 [Thermodesulfobacteriota bacterium]|nr:hypothetical protein [Thermodesulfobacteriota bacterium]
MIRRIDYLTISEKPLTASWSAAPLFWEVIPRPVLMVITNVTGIIPVNTACVPCAPSPRLKDGLPDKKPAF